MFLQHAHFSHYDNIPIILYTFRQIFFSHNNIVPEIKHVKSTHLFCVGYSIGYTGTCHQFITSVQIIPLDPPNVPVRCK